MRDFLKYTFASLLGILIFLGLSIGGLLTLLIVVASRDTGPQVKDKSVLVFDLSLNITDAKRSPSNLGQALSGDNPETVTLRSVLDAIDHAAHDPRITALYLYGDTDGAGGNIGFANLKEIREAVKRFRDSGKKVIAYDVNWREQEYYLSSVADTIVLNPIGSMELNGLSSQGVFYADALKKFGVGIQVTRVGKYKSAVEPLLLTKRSPESRQQTEALLQDLWNEFKTATGKDRKLSPQQLQALADSGGQLLPDEALKQRLVDKVAYLDEVIDQLKSLSAPDDDNKSFRQISLKTYTKVAEDALEKDRTSKNKIAIVYAEGEIVDGQGSVGEIGGNRLAKQLRQIRQDDDIKAVVLRVNSPGGSATASDIIQREVVLTQKVKPVVVSMGSVAASGGYWISTYSNRIFAEPNTITGSIGVFGIQPNIQELASKIGVNSDTVKTGRFADISSLYRPKTPQELAILQKSVDRIYDQFLTKVADARRLPKARVAEIAQGHVWSGQRAKELGLVDELGGLEDAIQDAAKRANLGNNWKLEEYPKSRSLEEQLFQRLAGVQADASSQPENPLTTEFKQVQADLAALKAMNDPLGVYARLPWNLRIH